MSNIVSSDEKKDTGNAKKKLLVVMIPAYNEEKSIQKVIKEIPRNIPGVETKVLVINDGSTDNTAQAAKEAGADYILTNKKNLGLAPTFKRGMDYALELGADIIINTDADFQYNQSEIPKLLKPILDGKADIVLTDRHVWKLSHMPLGKKLGNSIASFVTRKVSGYPVHDAQSGYRAFSREAALRINVMSDYTYVAETIIQAANKNLKMVQVDCEFRKRQDKSRLISNIFNYAKRAGLTIIRTYTRYKPLKVFLSLGTVVFIVGLAFALRVLVHYIKTGMVSPYIPSAILSAILMIVGFQLAVLALLADIIDAERRINEEVLYRIKKEQFSKDKSRE